MQELLYRSFLVLRAWRFACTRCTTKSFGRVALKRCVAVSGVYSASNCNTLSIGRVRAPLGPNRAQVAGDSFVDARPSPVSRCCRRSLFNAPTRRTSSAACACCCCCCCAVTSLTARRYERWLWAVECVKIRGQTPSQIQAVSFSVRAARPCSSVFCNILSMYRAGGRLLTASSASRSCRERTWARMKRSESCSASAIERWRA